MCIDHCSSLSHLSDFTEEASPALDTGSHLTFSPLPHPGHSPKHLKDHQYKDPIDREGGRKEGR